MKFILFAAANTIALLSGASLLSKSWLIATFVIDYVRAIFSESSNAPNGDFRNLSNNDFSKSEYNIKMKIFRNLIVSAIFFGFGAVGKFLDWL